MTNVKKLVIEGIPVEITKRKMKNMYIRIDKDTAVVKVSIPYRVSYGVAEDFVRKNMNWIINNRSQALNKLETAPKEYISGEKLVLWGEKSEIEYIPSYCDKGVYTKDGKVVILAPLDSDGEYRKKLVDSWYKEQLLEAINELKDECIKTVGKEPKEWRIRDMKTKWGTCNYRDGRIWISLNLVKKPKICLKYVMIHELTHLHVSNHGPQFKAYMDVFCTNWREIKRILNS